MLFNTNHTISNFPVATLLFGKEKEEFSSRLLSFHIYTKYCDIQ